jgi:putative ABC transport system permease protein
MRDLRLACRTLAATPIVTLVAIVSLALGIGANTAIFSLADSLLLRPLPIPDPDRLVAISDSSEAAMQYWHLAVWDEVRRADLFDALCAWEPARLTHTENGETQALAGAWVSGSYFATLGVRAQIGRVLSVTDDRIGTDGPVMVISDGFWRREFHADPAVVGHVFSVNDTSVTIVGVAARGFFGTDVGSSLDVLLPIAAEPSVTGRESGIAAGRMNVALLARLKPMETFDTTLAALRARQPQIREASRSQISGRPDDDPYLRTYMKSPFILIPAGSGTSNVRGRYSQSLIALLVTAALVLLVACGNVANLLLARGAARRHELSVRVALGASRWRLVRQLFAESAVLAALSCAAGWLLASWASRLLVNQLSIETARIALDLSPDWRIAAFATALAVVAIAIFGLLPAFQASGVAPIDALKEQGRSAAASTGRWSDALVVLQLALSVVLVVAAGLFLRTFLSLATRDLGFTRNQVLIARIDARRASVEPGQRIPTYERIRRAVQAVPGVADAALSVITPMSNLVFDPPIGISGTQVSSPHMYGNVISPGWFETYGIPIIAGRTILDRDAENAAPVAVVNEAFARRYFAATSPLDQFLTLPDVMVRPGANVPLRIVGVVADAVYVRLREAPQPTIYLSIVQHQNPFFAGSYATINLNVRSATDSPSQLAKSIATAIATVNPQLAVTFRPLSDQLSDALARERVLAMLAGFFGALALLLAVLGLYGVTTYAVTRRRAEMAIHAALGATPAQVSSLVLSHVAILVIVGITIGAVVSASIGRFVRSLLYGVTPNDLPTLLGAAAVLAIAAILAGWLPAWRASRIDPAVVLRES